MASVCEARKKPKLSNNKKRKLAQLADQALAAFSAGELPQAQQLCNQILEADAENPDAFFVLGLVAEKLGDIESARKLVAAACRARPNSTNMCAGLGQIHLKREDYASAEACWYHYTELKPSDPVGWQNLSAASYNRASFDVSEVAARKAAELLPGKAELHRNIALACMKLDKPTEAEASLLKALELDPEDAESHFAYGQFLMQKGDLEAAYECLLKSLELNPRRAGTYKELISFQKVKSYDDTVKQAEALYEDTRISAIERAHLAFALGKAWEDLGDYDKSFEYYTEGNQIRRDTWEYDLEDDRQDAEEIMRLFSKGFLDARCQGRDDGEALLFIVGMPRSGSTLTDQILSSHPDVAGAGEIDALRNFVSVFTRTEGKRMDMQKLIDATDEQLKVAAGKYLEMIREHYGDVMRITDKALPNLWMIGAIRLFFPKARILHCSRNPLDNCLSIFAHDFEGFLFKYGYNLKELGEYYSLYLRMMDHWREVLPGDVFLDVDYQALVADPEKEVRRLLDFCGLSWHEDCLHFYKAKRQVKTSSMTQVRQPIYRSAVNRWERYKEHLDPLIEALEGK